MAKRKPARKRTATKSSDGVWGIKYNSLTFLLLALFVLVVLLYFFYRIIWLGAY